MLAPLDFRSFDTAGNVAVVIQVCGVLRVLASATLAARAHACAGGISLEHKCLSSGCHKLHDDLPDKNSREIQPKKLRYQTVASSVKVGELGCPQVE